jgi:hypothetical protein
MFRDPGTLDAALLTAGFLALLLLLSACAPKTVHVEAPKNDVHPLSTVRGSWEHDAARPDILWLYTVETRDVQTALKEIGCGKTFYCAPEFRGTITVIETTPKDQKKK